MIVLGIDPGSRRSGYGLVEQDGSRLRHVDNGVFVLPTRGDFSARLLELNTRLEEILERYRPDVSAFESIFFSRNPQSALKLGHARGVAMLAVTKAGLAVHEYSPAEVKRAVAASGRADKRQVAEMVRVILGLPEVAQEDASDALAVAICHANHHPRLTLGAR